MTLLFPHETIRPSQKDFVKKVQEAVKKGENLIIHAPTGLGKTAASIAPAMTECINSDKTIFFLTSRHTQHEIAIKTLEDIKKRHGIAFLAVDIIGKKWMCSQQGVEKLPSTEFTEFCRTLREDGKCDYFSKLKKGEKITVEGKLCIEQLKEQSPIRNQKILSVTKDYGICPYYTSMELAKKAKLIIGDYFYIFHPRIREQFFNRSKKELEDAVIIIDEGHNLPERIKNLATSILTENILNRAIKEAIKNKLEEEITLRLGDIQKIIKDYTNKTKQSEKKEIYIKREDFIQKIQRLGDYDAFVETLIKIGDNIREEKQVSYIGAVAEFLSNWQGPNEGYARIATIKKGFKGEYGQLFYRCLDPGIIAKPIISRSHSTIIMSGTLTPTSMFKEIIGFEEGKLLDYPSPFPDKNRLNIIIPKTSTKFTSRSDQQYKDISEVLTKISAQIPGNIAVFFPSYHLLNEVKKYFQTKTDKTVFSEEQEMNTAQKQEFLDKFRSYKKTGAVLLAVISGNFGEGIDLPGDELKGVVIVGLPLQKPNLESESLINYYDKLFGKGWDYGYLFPAFNKTLQSAGRCIRSETDKGVIIFLDERYAWPQYKRCFPKDWNLKISLLYEKMISEFFKKNNEIIKKNYVKT